MVLVSMERGDPTLYHGTKQSYFGPVNFKFIKGVVTTPLVNHVTKKGLVGRGLSGKSFFFSLAKMLIYAIQGKKICGKSHFLFRQKKLTYSRAITKIINQKYRGVKIRKLVLTSKYIFQVLTITSHSFTANTFNVTVSVNSKSFWM